MLLKAEFKLLVTHMYWAESKSSLTVIMFLTWLWIVRWEECGRKYLWPFPSILNIKV